MAPPQVIAGFWSNVPSPVVAAVVRPDVRSLVLVLGVASIAAILSRVHSRVVLPVVVVEILLGIAIGPDAFAFASADAYLTFLSQLGLAMLFFFAGLEVVEQRVQRRSLVRGTQGWVISLVLGLAVGFALSTAGVDAKGWLIGVALATTALGALVPILSDSGLLPTPLGQAVLGAGVAGEFWPIVVISVFLTGIYGAGAELLLLVGFCLLVMLAAAAAVRARPPRVVRVLQETVHTTGQAAVRLAMFLLAALVLLAHDVGFDFVLGAFASGLVVGIALDSPEGHSVHMRLEGIGFGFLIPIYFVVTGMNFDLDSLLTRTGLALAALFMASLLIVRGVPAVLSLRELGARETVGLALFSATALPLLVAIVGIGTDRGAISAQVGASLIGAGMASVLIFPLVATQFTRRQGQAAQQLSS